MKLQPAFFLLFAGILPASASAQPLAQPAEESAEHAAAATPSWHQRSWEAAPYHTTVTSAPEHVLEEDLIGDYHQPRWTANRRFPTTRVYVLPRGTLNAEYWFTPRIAMNNGDDVRFRAMYELEYGLGYRLQLDVYFTTEQDGLVGSLAAAEEKIELRYALADWGSLWGNPTLYTEFVRHNGGPPKLETKLLLGDTLAPRWHWGLNLVWERVMGQTFKQEYSVTAAASYAAIDMCLSLGLEFVAKMFDHDGARFHFDQYSLMAGPSIVWRPVIAMRLLLVGLFGANVAQTSGTESLVTPIAEPTLIVSWEF